MTHPALDALRRAHDELLLARLELRNGPPALAVRGENDGHHFQRKERAR